jgi:hypothetical protein
MAKKEPVENAETTAETTDVAVAREKRLSLTNVAPAAVNGFAGSVTATIAETGEQVVFTFVTPELPERDARAITAGFAGRISIAASGKKDAADILIAVTEEIAALNAGVFAVRGSGSSAQSSFSDTVISIALLRGYPDVAGCKFSEEEYQTVVANLVLLASVQADWDAADEAGKKAMVTDDVTKTKRLVGFFKL